MPAPNLNPAADVLSSMPARFSLSHRGSKWSANVTPRMLEDALHFLFNEVAYDLGVERMRSGAFVDYAGDAMSGADVPDAVIKRAKTWLRKGAQRDTLAWKA